MSIHHSYAAMLKVLPLTHRVLEHNQTQREGSVKALSLNNTN
ncbi:hypothetical protein THF1A12_290021 [Vibrio jasicida]|uniref:Uncharacterized protein n=1 Tax=Vibrio jasicida TaxID=766224 RepID=A0AAU9QPG4_9VIBR|nr:hypothetical protein THF1A12_290021 [Vibrio jasicida]